MNIKDQMKYDAIRRTKERFLPARAPKNILDADALERAGRLMYEIALNAKPTAKSLTIRGGLSIDIEEYKKYLQSTPVDYKKILEGVTK